MAEGSGDREDGKVLLPLVPVTGATLNGDGAS
jgi:hypothetical protein